jgi:hypothetical protein
MLFHFLEAGLVIPPGFFFGTSQTERGFADQPMITLGVTVGAGLVGGSLGTPNEPGLLVFSDPRYDSLLRW